MAVYVVVHRVEENGKHVYKFDAPDPIQDAKSPSLPGLLNQIAAAGWQIVTSGDFDGDGVDEIVVVHH